MTKIKKTETCGRRKNSKTVDDVIKLKAEIVHLTTENERLKKETVKEILQPLYNTFNKIKDYWFFGEIMSLLASKAREYGVELKEEI